MSNKKRSESARAAHARPEVKERHSSAMKAVGARPGFKERQAELKRGRPRSEETRRKISGSLKGRKLSEAQKVGVSEGLRRYYTSVAGVDASAARVLQAEANRFTGPTATRHELRRRDGDLCQLCLATIDFALTKKTGGGMNPVVDHIVPKRHGGGDESRNLWLAHDICNTRKGPHYIGREDRTTDIRRTCGT